MASVRPTQHAPAVYEMDTRYSFIGNSRLIKFPLTGACSHIKVALQTLRQASYSPGLVRAVHTVFNVHTARHTYVITQMFKWSVFSQSIC